MSEVHDVKRGDLVLLLTPEEPEGPDAESYVALWNKRRRVPSLVLEVRTTTSRTTDHVRRTEVACNGPDDPPGYYWTASVTDVGVVAIADWQWAPEGPGPESLTGGEH